ncbi:MAG: bifunctional ornithine acetyltransferase/N-acetylglutamate synthase, partial [Peptococcus niger]
AYRAFAEALKTLCIALAKDIAADGEGASQLLICQVLDAASTADARQVAKSVISSSLVKTAIYGGDANWGRIICACGYAGVPIDPAKIDITVKSGAGFATVCEKGRATGISRREINYIFKQPPLTLEIKLGQGKAEAEAYGCDLTERYVAINAEYEV